MKTDIERREFLKKGFAVGAAFSLMDLGGLFAEEEKEKTKVLAPKVDLVAVRNGSLPAMLDAAMKEWGGMSAFVKPGQRVVIKPNASFDKGPEMGANVHPELVGHVVKLCMEAGAKEVNVFDHTCHDWKLCYKKSGIESEVEKAGGKMIPGNDDKLYVDQENPKGKVLKKARIHQLIKESEVFINIPILKHHSGTVMTGAMKNLMGMVWDRGFFHKEDLHQCIADSVTLRQPDLNILDAYTPMMRNGPMGKDEKDLMPKVHTLIVSPDIVACDAAGSMILGHKQNDIKHVALGNESKLGVSDLSKLQIKRINLSV